MDYLLTADAKLYFLSTIQTQMNLVLIFFWADRAVMFEQSVRSILKTPAILLMYPTIEVFLSYFSWQDKYKILYI